MTGSHQVNSLLEGAYDIHVHCGPDIVRRAQEMCELAQQAADARMAGVGIKDHATCTVGRVHALNTAHETGPRFFSCITLNPPVGGLNPSAVEAALRAGVDIVYFPTYAARHHIDTLGASAFPVPQRTFEGLAILDQSGSVVPEAVTILDTIARYEAVLATGHLAPVESLALLRRAAEQGVGRSIVTHASEAVPAMSVDMQCEAVALGAFIEQSFLAVTDECPGKILLEQMRDEIRAVGPEHVVLSSDFGQPQNGPPVAGFVHYLEKLIQLGVSRDDVRVMTVDNPRRLLYGRRIANS
jgi:hypothetical protein